MSESREQTTTPAVCVRWYDSDPGPCAGRGGPPGIGPVGFRLSPEPGPLCDPCLARAEPGLGRLLVAVNAIRELADSPPADPWPVHHRALVLTLVAKLYHRHESRTWPYRGDLMADFMDRTTAAGVSVPIEAAVALAEDLIEEVFASPSPNPRP
ncbi:MAG: hypothetical protein V3T72_00705 [Thermoanaerobaculia bacterium]